MVVQEIEQTSQRKRIEEAGREPLETPITPAGFDLSKSSRSTSNYWSLFGFLTEGWRRAAVGRQSETQNDTPIEPPRFRPTDGWTAP